MSEEVKKYLWDIQQAIIRLEMAVASKTFEEFDKDVLLINAVERNFEILGEAVKRIKQKRPDLEISDYLKIIGMRNLIAHNYEGVEPITLWVPYKRTYLFLRRKLSIFLKRFSPPLKVAHLAPRPAFCTFALR